MAHGLLVVGASQAGVSLATSLRAVGYDRPITLVGDENHRPYQRPPLSKEFLTGAVSKEALILRSEGYWAEHRIDVVPNQRIVRIDKGPAGSGVAHSTSGTAFRFDRLALTVGARARGLPVPGADLPGVLRLRTADDALELTARVPATRRVVVVGGGFVGLEAAASLTALGRAVTLVEAADRLAARAVGPETSAVLLDRHRGAGVDVRLGATVRRVVARGDRVAGVELATGEVAEVLAADLVLVGVGVVPNTELAQSIGLACDDGITVDRYAVASDGVTVAAGDCANVPNPAPGAPAGARVRLESVNGAVEQGKVAAHTIAGRHRAYAGVPWFWSHQGAVRLQVAGLSAGHDSTEVRAGTGRDGWSVRYYRNGGVVAADCVNAPRDFVAVRKALAAGAAVPVDEVRS